MTTTILLLVSREDYLDEVFTALNDLQCNKKTTALLCIVNGDNQLFVDTRNRCELSKFSQRLAIQVKPKQKIRQYDIGGRRKAIAELHNEAKTHINSEYVFGIEDDTIVPKNALKRLMQYADDVELGMASGVELGRWGIPYIGAWRVDDINNPTSIVSLAKGTAVEPIDAGGFYCFLTPAKHYQAHTFEPFDGNGLGPDVNFGLALRQQGLNNYADFDIKCTHKTTDKDITFANTKPRQIKMYKRHNQWRQDIIKESDIV